ncbi:aldo-keto reductase family 1 member A1-A isoform X3 [Dunckerocampus dactyliophorus]|uniref:aldo-keto reductase family 1 member A1-A isoform X3 n=1 Tax=Dunckerocampus dactyliophorus TaxID=161453 RepID=UPI00240599E6|nr:aldo-keto reductase family 1 member A1-A isoform X3 [Dunckerocampus dactyliophorus]
MSAFVTLTTGQRMPMVGLGTWKSAPGQALRREQVFLTSKLWNTKHDPSDVEEACKTSLDHLGVSYLDLYLMHWPMAFQPGKELMPRREDGSVCYSDTHYKDTWAAMESLVDYGLVKAIGLSNFNARQTDDIIRMSRHKPVVNQVECHPYLSQVDLLAHCRSVAVCLTAYSPLGSGDRPWATTEEPCLLQDHRLVEISKRYHKTPAQVILRQEESSLCALVSAPWCVCSIEHPHQLSEPFCQSYSLFVSVGEGRAGSVHSVQRSRNCIKLQYIVNSFSIFSIVLFLEVMLKSWTPSRVSSRLVN